jgi:hypothetical protein
VSSDRVEFALNVVLVIVGTLLVAAAIRGTVYIVGSV